MKIELAKDKDGYTAKVAGRKNLFAFGYTKQEALEELGSVATAELESDPLIAQVEKRIQEYLHKIDHEG